MDNNGKRNIADTRELNSILDEARRNRENGFNVDSRTSTPRSVITRRNFDDDFVLYTDEEVTVPANKQQPKKDNKMKSNNKKSQNNKKGVNKKAVALIVMVSILFVALVTFAVYKTVGDFKYADNVYINGVCVGGMSQRDAKKAVQEHQKNIENNIKITVEADGNNIVLTNADLDFSFDIDAALNEAKEYTKSAVIKSGHKDIMIPLSIDNESCVNAAKKVAENLDCQPVNAMVTEFDSSKEGNDRFVFSESKNGVAVNQTALVTQLHSFASEGKTQGLIKATTDVTEPKYTEEYIRVNVKKLSGFTTTSTNNSNGNDNMKLSLSQCNNSIINPGETWSFNKCTGNSNLTSNGYKPAGVIVNGKNTTGIGGGICQSSTTIYNAALLCGMEVVERECHYYKSSYVDAGRDATVDYGHIDLKLKNIFDYQLFMECYMDGVVLHCNFYGIPNPEFDEIKIDSQITEYLANGFRAETSRTFYLNGKEVKTEKLPKSRYYTSAPSTGDDPTEEPTEHPSEKPTDAPTGDPTDPVTPPTDAPTTAPPVDNPTDTPPVVENPAPDVVEEQIVTE